MKIGAWFRKRSPGFVLQRGRGLLGRYGLGAGRAVHRLERCLDTLAQYGCAPTLPVPALVVERHAPAIRHIQSRGVELAVHGYNHVDLKVYPADEAGRQLERAARVFAQYGVEVHGFRCPYLSYTDALLGALPPGLFAYSSNQAIAWADLPQPAPMARGNGNVLFETLKQFYVPRTAADTISLPWMQAGLVEIPVSVPDDLQLRDGLGYDPAGLARVWIDLLERTHRGGEVFNLMFHPELASFCEAPFVELLRAARALRPGVWAARLCDIAQWWREKAALSIQLAVEGGRLHVHYDPLARATLLVRGVDLPGLEAWDGVYRWARSADFYLPADPLPLVGLAPEAGARVAQFLSNQGYLLAQGEQAHRCAVYLSAQDLSGRAWVERIERHDGPLLRLWPWPDGMRSALCISGDLDALSLLDYAARLFAR